MTNYQKPSWANWKKYSQSQLVRVFLDEKLGEALIEADRVDWENKKLYESLAATKAETIQSVERMWGASSRQVQYLKRQKIDKPPVWKNLFWKYRNAVLEACARSDRNAKARKRRQEKKRLAEIDAQIVERYGSGWVEQEGS